MTVEKYRDALISLGPQGSQVFANLTTAVMQADAPLTSLTTKFKGLGTTMMNTLKWQISSSALHAFMGSISGAFNYSEKLNTSLNNIRIVTGKSADEMTVFAKQANEAAKSLSTTTTKYTDAALIYYQQGLSDDEVKRRTDVTAKMANVTGESASHVSSYMTAIWNNFAEGSDNLIYFSDVLTALGAATAASSEEIANGLEKFASVGETVGLSYEYATSALTTIIDKTRQSEDVVGTALKTIFARIQGLQQGEEQDDGVTLNKYSKALQNVGISILDANGNLKQMDNILDEMGAKWETLSQAEQVALAQTVGGTRQYTQLISLMENWDSFQKNVNIAKGSAGTTDQQAEIYAESWKAAKERVQASLQGIYDSILDDKFFIGLTDFFAGFLDGIENLIDGLGGMKGLFLTIGTIITTVFQDKLAKGLQNASLSLMSFTKSGKKASDDMKQGFISALKTSLGDEHSTQGHVLSSIYDKRANFQISYLENEKKMDALEKEKIKNLMNMYSLEVQIAEQKKQQIDFLETENSMGIMAVKGKGLTKQQKKTYKTVDARNTAIDEKTEELKQSSALGILSGGLKNSIKDIDSASNAMKAFKKQFPTSLE